MTLLVLLLCAFILVTFCLYAIYRTQVLVYSSETHVSQCCSFPLTFQDQIPIVSWIQLKGRCRYCQTAIPFQYPIWEFSALVLILMSSYILGLGAALLLTSLTLIAVIDLRTGRIPTPLVIFCGFLALCTVGLQNVLLAFILYMMGQIIHALLPKPTLGRGDVKFLAMAGLWISFSQLPFYLVLAGLGGIGTAIALRQRIFPLGPALCFALGLTVLLGKEFDPFKQILGSVSFFS